MIGFGQSWEKDIFPIQNSNTSIQIYSAKQTLDQGYIVTGVFDTLFTNLPWSASILEDGFVFLLRLDQQGDTIWSKLYLDAESVGTSVVQTQDSSYVILGVKINPLDSLRYPFIMKTNPQGNTLWAKHYLWAPSGFGPLDLHKEYDGGYSFAIGNILIKLDSQGDTLWTKNLYLNNIQRPGHLKNTLDSGYAFIEYLGSPFDSIWRSNLVKTDSEGDILWLKTYFPSDSLFLINGFNQTSDNGYIISVSKSQSSFDTVNVQILNNKNLLIKTDYQGDTIWTKTYDLSPFNTPFNYNAIINPQQTSDGGYVFAYAIYDTLSINQLALRFVKTDYQGDTLWTKTIARDDTLTFNYEPVGLASDEVFFQTIDAGYFFAFNLAKAYTKEDARSYIWLIKTDGNGNITSSFDLPIIKSASKGQLIKIVDLLGRETKGKKKQPLFYIYDDGTVEKRLVIE
ncbi:MAG: hypothetical protein CMP73_02215 [Flavobacteriales bacterium]|nr:hypothetical protein [Flavobacteriales bacterium]